MKTWKTDSRFLGVLCVGVLGYFAATPVCGQQVPPAVYQTVVPGFHLSKGVDMAVDGAGNVFVLASAVDLSNDAVVAKIDPTGVILWSRWLRGSFIDFPGGIALDPQGNPVVVGATGSDDFPILNGYAEGRAGLNDAFITRLDAADGAVLYSTYLGGSKSDGATDIVIGDDGRMYVTGFTGSLDFPTVDAVQQQLSAELDTFVVILDPTGQVLEFSTYLGGHESDQGRAIVLDAAENIIISGHTKSTDFPTLNAMQDSIAGKTDLFVAVYLAGTHDLDSSTYLGGEDEDYLGRMGIGPDGGVFLAGSTRSVGFPTTAGVYQPQFVGTVLGCEVPFGQDYNCEDMFLTKLTPDAAQIGFSTYLGGTMPDFARGVAIDRYGRAHLVGYSSSTDYPGFDGQYGIIMSRLSADGSMLDYTFAEFSGSYNAGHGIAIGPDDDVYFAGAINVPADIYVVRLEGGCVGDFNGDGVADTRDVLAFLNAWTAGDPEADCTGDGMINTQDVLCFLNAWNTGC